MDVQVLQLPRFTRKVEADGQVVYEAAVRMTENRVVILQAVPRSSEKDTLYDALVLNEKREVIQREPAVGDHINAMAEALSMVAEEYYELEMLREETG